MVSKAAQKLRTSYLYDEDDDGIFGVVMRGISTFEDSALRGSSRSAGGSSSS